jgi:hypothetical protein
MRGQLHSNLGRRLLRETRGSPIRSYSIPALSDPAQWPAPDSEDTELGVLMEREVCHGETEVHTGVQALEAVRLIKERGVSYGGLAQSRCASVAVARLGEGARG